MLTPLLKDHLGVDLARPGEDYLGAFDLEGGDGALHAGQLRFLIGKQHSGIGQLQGAVGHQLRGIRVNVVKILLSPNGEQDGQLFSFNTGQCRSSVPHG